MTLLEGLLVLYFAFGVLLAFYLADFGLLPFHLMLIFGFGTVFYYSVIQSGGPVSNPGNLSKQEARFAEKIIPAH